MRRRDFVQRLPVVTTGLVVGASLPLTGCAGAIYVTPTPRPDGLSVPESAIGADGVFVPAPGLGRPLWIGRDAAGTLVALLASCTHRGCQPEPVGARLVCPCHGSEFSRSGEVLKGPAAQPLRRYPSRIEGGQVIVRIAEEGGE